ncbi:hypothetical protein ZEAMMB73_Zm00001d038507 [Zea mays]|uniref:Uncharacterized protein n=1 Tax=Zea mays TaxID=4577 RepID=A0A1D6M6U3_MAIZE|nr:hypothetical protein ZEAMMB73_Zm00001d038507 [Zea mays]
MSHAHNHHRYADVDATIPKVAITDVSDSLRIEKEEIRIEEFIESQRAAMDRFLTSNQRTSTNTNELAIVVVEEQPNINLGHQGITPNENVDINMDDNNVSGHEPIFSSSPTKNANVDEQSNFTEDNYDPRNILITSQGAY